LKATMMEDIAHDEDERARKKRRSNDDTALGTAVSEDDYSTVSATEDTQMMAQDADVIWKDRKRFSEEAANNHHLLALSPEEHGVLWHGSGVRHRSSLPKNLYNRAKNALLAITRISISSNCKEAFKSVMQSGNRQIMLERIEDMRAIKGDQSQMELVVDIFSLFAEQIYDNLGSTLTDKETRLDANLLEPWELSRYP
ncbi:hypothetical protein BCR43DRAFT_435448, partial [Syncephalastrum racemosum]